MPASALFLAFGKIAHPGEALAREGADLAARGGDLGRQVAIIRTDTAAFRLNSPGWMKPPPELIAALPGRDDLRMLCRDRIEAMTPAFAASARRWTAGYLDAVERTAGTDAQDTGLTSPSDRVFASLLPLPSPWIGQVDLDTDGAHLREDLGFTRFDLAFWNGHRLVVVAFGGVEASTPKERAAIDRLLQSAEGRIELRRITDADSGTALIEELMRTTDAPEPWYGPYRAEALQAALP